MSDMRKRLKQGIDDAFEAMYQEEVEARQDEYDAIKRKFLAEQAPKKKYTVLPKIGMVAGFCAAVLILSLVFSDLTRMQALQADGQQQADQFFDGQEEKKAYASIDEVVEQEHVLLPQLHYIPDGFEVSEITFRNMEMLYLADFTMYKGEQYINLTIQNIPQESASSEIFSFHDFERIDKDGKVIAISELPPYNAVVFYGMFEIYLTGNVAREELLKIIDGIQ